MTILELKSIGKSLKINEFWMIVGWYFDTNCCNIFLIFPSEIGHDWIRTLFAKSATLLDHTLYAQYVTKRGVLSDLKHPVVNAWKENNKREKGERYVNALILYLYKICPLEL